MEVQKVLDKLNILLSRNNQKTNNNESLLIIRFEDEYGLELLEFIINNKKIFAECMKVQFDGIALASCIIQYNEVDEELIRGYWAQNEKILNNGKLGVKISINLGRLETKIDEYIAYETNCSVISKIVPNYEEFLKVFDLSDFNDIEKKYDRNKKNIFLFLDKDIKVFNSWLYYFGGTFANSITSNIKPDNELCEKQVKKIIDKRNRITSWNSGSSWITPKHLYFTFNNMECEIAFKIALVRKFYILVCIFVSNITSLDNDELVSTIKGSNEVVVRYEFNKYELNIFNYVKNVLEVYEYIYGSEDDEKILILRNVIGMVLVGKNDEDNFEIFIKKSKWIISNVKDKYQLYLSKNIAQYFKNSDNLTQKLKEKADKVENEIYNIVALISKHILSLVGFIIAGSIGYIAKGDLRFIKILGMIYVGYVIIITVIVMPIYGIKFIQLSKDHSLIKKKLDEDFAFNLEKRYEEKYNHNSLIFAIYFWGTIVLVIFMVIVIYIYGIQNTDKVIEIINRIIS